MLSQIDIYVRAPGRVVFDLARDVSNWPTLLQHHKQVTVLSRDHGEAVASMHALRPIGRFAIPVREAIEQVSSRRLPLLGSELLPAFVDPLFVRPIAGRTLATFKHLAEDAA